MLVAYYQPTHECSYMYIHMHRGEKRMEVWGLQESTALSFPRAPFAVGPARTQDTFIMS